MSENFFKRKHFHKWLMFVNIFSQKAPKKIRRTQFSPLIVKLGFWCSEEAITCWYLNTNLSPTLKVFKKKLFSTHPKLQELFFPLYSWLTWYHNPIFVRQKPVKIPWNSSNIYVARNWNSSIALKSMNIELTGWQKWFLYL